MVAVRKEIELERLGFNAELVWDVGNINGRKVWLSGDWAQGSKFRTVEFDEIVIFHMTIVKGFEDFWLIVKNVGSFFVAQ